LEVVDLFFSCKDIKGTLKNRALTDCSLLAIDNALCISDRGLLSLVSPI